MGMWQARRILKDTLLNKCFSNIFAGTPDILLVQPGGCGCRQQ
jgi:hypothetical protein